MQPREVDVCIVGGGVAGLSAACALRKAGRSVLVLEQREQPSSGDVHRGDVVSGGDVEALKSWGIDLELREAVQVRRSVVEAGDRVVATRTAEDGDVAFSLAHPRIEEALLDAALSLGVEVFLGWQLQALYPDATGRLRKLTAVSLRGGVELSAKLVVGSDGRSSKVRESLGLKVHSSVPTTMDLLAMEIVLPPSAARTPNDAVLTKVGPEGGARVVPIGPDRVRALVALRRGEHAGIESQPGEAILAAIRERLPLTQGVTVDRQRVRRYERTDGYHLANYVGKGAVIVGDAAHLAPPPAPFGLQMAFEDAVELGRLVGPVVAEGDKPLDKALARYELKRWERNEALLAESRKWVEWLAPLPGVRAAVLRTPLGGRAVRLLQVVG